MLIQLIRRELRLACRRSMEVSNPLWFFLIVIVLFPLGIGPEPLLLSRIAPGVIWVAALLSTLLALEYLFRDDFIDGSLEQLLLSSVPLPLAVLGKVLAHWLLTGLPLIILSPLVALLFSLNFASWRTMLLTLLLGTPALGFLGAIGAGLTVGLRRGGVLLSLIMLPLMLPILIFASSAMDAASQGLPVDGYLAVLGAILIVSILLAPFASALALRVSLY